MDTPVWVNTLVTVAACAVSAYLTVRILIAELKTDVSNLKESLGELKKVVEKTKEDTTELRVDIAGIDGYKRGTETRKP